MPRKQHHFIHRCFTNWLLGRGVLHTGQHDRRFWIGNRVGELYKRPSGGIRGVHEELHEHGGHYLCY
jgi:hypothetical protein